MTGRSSLIRNVALLAGSACFALLLAEGALRVGHVEYSASLFQSDPDRGWALRPNAEGWHINETKNYVRINSDGLHDREHPIYKPSNTLRIAILGDSCTESLQQPLEKAFPSVVEHELSNCPTLRGRRVEVLNFGVSGYGTAQELLTLRSRVWKYSPDMVLVAFYAGNDVFNNHRAFNPSLGAKDCPYFSLQNGRLILDESFRKSPDLRPGAMRWQAIRTAIVNHLRTAQLFYSVINTYRQRLAEKQQKAAAKAMQISTIDDQIYLPPTSPKLQDAWGVTEALLTTMNNEVRARGVEFWIVDLWTNRQVAPDSTQRKQFCQTLGLTNLSYPDLRLQAVAAKEKIPLMLLAPAVATYAKRHNVFVNGGVLLPAGTGHFNELGHRLAGHLIASELCSRSSLITAMGKPLPAEAVVACQDDRIAPSR